MQATCPGRSLNASLTRRATITSPSTSTLPHAKLNPRHSSTLYNARRPRLRLTRGESSKYSGVLKQDQTTCEKAKCPGVHSPTPLPRAALPAAVADSGRNSPSPLLVCLRSSPLLRRLPLPRRLLDLGWGALRPDLPSDRRSGVLTLSDGDTGSSPALAGQLTGRFRHC
jgi:hypothetical protein